MIDVDRYREWKREWHTRRGREREREREIFKDRRVRIFQGKERRKNREKKERTFREWVLCV